MPDRLLVGGRLQFGRGALDAAGGAGFHDSIGRGARQDTAHPPADDGLMHQELALDSGFFDQPLAAGSVPLIDRGIRRELSVLPYKRRMIRGARRSP